MNQTNNENRGMHGKSINYYTGTGHCPSTGHPYIKTTHHERNNSKEERFPLALWLPRTTLCVWMCCSDHYSKGDSHTKRIDLHCDETFNTGNSESCLCNSIVIMIYTLRVKTLELLHNGECISWPQSDYMWPKQMHDLAVTGRSHHPQ